MLSVRDFPDDGRERRPPVLHVVRTAEGNRCVLRTRLPGPLATELRALLEGEPVTSDLDAPPRQLDAAIALLERHGLDPEPVYFGPAYVLPRAEPPAGPVRVTADNRDALARHFPSLLEDGEEPVFVVVEDGDAVSACSPARLLGAAVEAGVRTAEGFEGRGYAAQVVAAWAAEIHARELLPLYSTWRANAASIAVAAKLGATRYGDDFHLG